MNPGNLGFLARVSGKRIKKPPTEVGGSILFVAGPAGRALVPSVACYSTSGRATDPRTHGAPASTIAFSNAGMVWFAIVSRRARTAAKASRA